MNRSTILLLLLSTPSPTRAQTSSSSYPTSTYVALMSNDTLINADLWDETPKIFTANYAFEGIQGVEDMTQAGVEAAGGSWYAGTTCNLTTAQSPSALAAAWGWPTNFADAMPVVFSWPVKASTVNATDFLLTLNTGEKVYPDVASIAPNTEWNERSTVVVFGQFGNRISPGSPGAEYVVRVDIVDDGNPLMLVGPQGKLFNAVGLSYDASCCPPYGPDSVGPGLVAAKISRYDDDGEYTSADAQGFPNSCTEIYGSRSTDFRLRMYTSGGFSPDGITGMTPDSYRQYFRLHAQIDDGTGETMTLDEPNVEYAIPLADGTTGRYLRAWVVGEWLGWACRCAPCSPQRNTRSCADVSGWSAAMVHTP